MNKTLSKILTATLTGILLTGCSTTSPTTSETTSTQTTVAASTTATTPANGTTFTIGISQFAEHPSLDNCRKGFIEGLKQSGFEEGKNVKFEYQNSQSDFSVANSIAQNFVASKVSLIAAIATPSAQTAYTAVDGKDIPVVITAVSDPVAAGLAETLDKPFKGVTGTSDIIPAEKQLSMIREFLPNAKTIGILYSTGEVNSEVQIEMYKKAATNLGFTIETAGVSNQSEIPMALDNLLTKVDCINNLTDNTVVSALTTIVDKANEKKIPVFGSEEEQVKNGCLASEGINYYELGIQTGKMAADVLNGKAAESIPIEAIKESDLVVNKAALSNLGLTLPKDFESRVTYVGE